MRIEFLGEKRFPAARVIENIRGEDVMRAPEFAGLIAEGKAFSLNIANNYGELKMRPIAGGGWEQQVVSVDKVFGIMRSKWRAVRA